MTDFFRIDANVLHDGRILDAADQLPEERQADALTLYVVLWAMNRAEGQAGTVATSHVNRAMRAYGWPIERTGAALAALFTTGALAEEPANFVKIADWGDFWYCGQSATERKANQRAREACHGGGRDTPVTGGAVTSDRQTDRQTVPTTTTTRAGAREDVGGGGGGGGRSDNTMSPQQAEVFDALTKAVVFPASRPNRVQLACLLVNRGVSPQDIDDLTVYANSQQGIANPGAWLADVLKDSGSTTAAIREAQRLARKGASIYGEDAPDLVTPGDPSRCIKPADVGIVWCDECKATALGKHWIDHGPIGWRPGQPKPEKTEAPPTPPAPQPVGDPSDWIKVLGKKTHVDSEPTTERKQDEATAKKLLKFKQDLARDVEKRAKKEAAS